MISNDYSSAVAASPAPDQLGGPHEFRGLRKPFIAGTRAAARQAGFTLVELMIVLGVITIVAVIAFSGIRNNQWEGAYMRFTDDLVGTMIQARNRAIDDQTVVRVEVSVDRVEVFWIDPEAPVPDPTVMGSGTFLWGNYRDRIDGGLIAASRRRANPTMHRCRSAAAPIYPRAFCFNPMVHSRSKASRCPTPA
jgi:prepilin-type N-terminal cleavage/methylation domain-containing protein